MNTSSKTKPTDFELVEAVRNDASSEAFLEICERHQGVFFQQCHKYAPALASCGIDLRDIFAERDAVIYGCIKSFDPNKGSKLSSWIGNYARYLCLNSMNSKRVVLPSHGEDAQKLIDDENAAQAFFDRTEDLGEYKDYIFHILGEMKDKRIKRIFEERYFSGNKAIWSKIAKSVGASTQTVMSLHKKGVTLVRHKIKNAKNLCDYV